MSDEKSKNKASSPPHLSDEAIRMMVDDAIRRNDLWTVAEWMKTTTGQLRWNSCWVAVERMILSVWHIKAGRAVSYIANEFMPDDTPTKINMLLHEGLAWMLRRLKDQSGHTLALRRLGRLRQRLDGRTIPCETPTIQIKGDDPERVLPDYLALSSEAGLTLRFTRPATAILVALPLHALKAALSRLVDLYEPTGGSRSRTLVTLRALRGVLRPISLKSCKSVAPFTPAQTGPHRVDPRKK